MDVLGCFHHRGSAVRAAAGDLGGPVLGLGSYRILGLLTYSALSLALFVVIELAVADPLLDIRLFRYWAFTNSMLLISVLSVVLLGVVFYIPQFLQVAQGWRGHAGGMRRIRRVWRRSGPRPGPRW
ncbi:MAG: hypothetical protein M3Y73_11820 [Actinomycetota bacterium]|nr:hypothetical protein [Actinomycetota bacterium]